MPRIRFKLCWIIIGPPFRLKGNRIKVELNKITDTEMFKKRNDLHNIDEIKELKERYGYEFSECFI